MFHLLATYNNFGAAQASLASLNAVADTVFSTQNSNFIFTDRLQLLAACAMGATLTNAAIYSPSLLPYGLFYVWPMNLAATPGNYPPILNTTDYPMPIPQNEQIQFQVTATAAGGEADTGFMWVAPSNWNRNWGMGTQRSLLKVTAAITRVANAWSGLNAITFVNQPRGGWYYVNGVWCSSSTCRAFRLFFPRAPGMDQTGRVLRPGSLVTNAAGNLELPNFASKLGVWGAFHTFEPFTMEGYADAAGATTLTAYVDCMYVGQGDAGGSYPALP